MDDAPWKSMAALGLERLPTQDDLPCSDGMPMETQRHVLQMYLLMDPLWLLWAERDAFVGGNMFIYFSLEQVRNRDFRGPDVFVVLDVPRGERKSWVVWQEGKGPDVVIEIISESTAATDRGEKKQVYQDELQTPEYFWYDPFSGERAGFRLQDGTYTPITPDADGRLLSDRLQLALVSWRGTYGMVEADWLRWATPEGVIIPTEGEAAQDHARAAQREAEAAQREAEAVQQHASELEALLARYRQQFGDVNG